MEKMKSFGLLALVVGVALASDLAPAVYRIACYILLIAMVVGLFMELKSGQEAKERLRRYE